MQWEIFLTVSIFLNKNSSFYFKLSSLFIIVHENMMRGNGRGTVIQKNYVSSTRIDENGRRVEENYFNNNIAQRGEDGNTVKNVSDT